MELCLNMNFRPSSQLDATAELALIERCRKQDAEAFTRIVDAYQHRLFGFVRRMVPDPEEAADLAQETFVRAFQSISRFDGRSSVRTWLFRIAYNLCVDRSRRAGRAPAEMRLDAFFEDEEGMDLPDARWDPQGVVMDEELRSTLERAIAAMSEKLRSVLLLHDREDMSYEEIARALGIPIGTVKSRLFLARAFLQRALTPYLLGEVRSHE